MSKKFLTAIMVIVLGGSILTGCTTSKENVPVEEKTEITTEENTVDDNIKEENIEQSETEVMTDEHETYVETEETVTEPKVEDTINTEVDKNTSVQTETEAEVEEVYGEVDPSVAQEMLFVITDGIELPNRVNMDATMFKDTYGIASKYLSSYVVSTPITNVHATEIAVFEVVNETAREAVKTGIEKRVEALTKQWQTYLPEQYELVKNYKVVDKGNLVLFVISDQADSIISKFNAAV